MASQRLSWAEKGDYSIKPNTRDMATKSVCFLIALTVITSSCSSEGDVEEIPPKTGMINVSGGQIWYRMSGIGKTGTPLIILHGGPGAAHNYLLNLDTLSEHRPVIFYDQLGSGLSDRPSDTMLWNTDRFVDELHTLVTSLKIDQFHLLGQSWGAYLAASYSLKYDNRIKSIVFSAPLLSATRWIEDQRFWISQLPAATRDTIEKYEALGEYGAESYQQAMDLFYRRHLCRLDPWPDLLMQTFDNMGAEVYNYMWGPSEFTVTGTLKEADLSEQLPQIDVPVLFTCGEFDEATPAAINHFAGLMKNAELQIFENASHMHHLEDPEKYLGLVREFLQKHD
ncbi:MAG: proline iminopeptidase-family hydrolase [Bacteroidetes bacterium]|nr:proline iminopeptidase-family hydrolase [Bacteroidota bacterium]